MVNHPPAVVASNQDVRDANCSARLTRRFVVEGDQITRPRDVTPYVHNGRTDIQVQQAPGPHLGSVPRVELVARGLADDQVRCEHVPDRRAVVEAVVDTVDVAGRE